MSRDVDVEHLPSLETQHDEVEPGGGAPGSRVTGGRLVCFVFWADEPTK